MKGIDVAYTFTMMNPSFVDEALVAEFRKWVAYGKKTGDPYGFSTSELIVSALISGRPDWLPHPYKDPVDAIDRLIRGGAEWWHSALFVKGQDYL